MNKPQDSQQAVGMQFSSQISCDPSYDQHNNTSEAPLMDSSQMSVSSDKSKILENVEIVQNLIERCMQLYMDRNEVLKFISDKLKIEPALTTLIWQKLEEENADFFQVYYTRLSLKRQILYFSDLLEKQYNLMKHQSLGEVQLAPMQSGSHQMPVNNLPVGYPALQQSPLSSTVHSQNDYDGSMSSCLAVNRIPEICNDHSMQMFRSEMMNRMLPINPTSGIKSEIALSSAMVAPTGQFPFTSADISGLSIDNSAFDSTFTSNMHGPEGLQPEPDSGCGIYDEYIKFPPMPYYPGFQDPNPELPGLEGMDFFTDTISDPGFNQKGDFKKLQFEP